MQESELIRIATSVRESIENIITDFSYVDVELQNFPAGACEVSSVILGLYLKENFDIEIVQSVGKRTDPRDKNSHNNHVWLTMDDTVLIDITGDQFEDFSPKVFVGKHSEFHNQFKIYDIRPVDFSYLVRRGSEGYEKVFKEVQNLMASK